MKKNGKKIIKKAFALMLALVMAVPTVDYGTLLTAQAEETGNTGITLRTRDDGKAAASGYDEGAYVEWLPVAGAGGYEVYVSQDNDNWPEKPIDDELIRSYGDYWRADALGLTKGTWYVKVVAAVFDADKNKISTVAEKIERVTVTAHDRSGYAWEGYLDDEEENANLNTPGAYKKDGSLKDDAKVIYVTDVTKDTVSLELDGLGETCTGIQRIIDGYKKGKEINALAVRIIGNVDVFAYNDKGDMAIENGQKAEAGITIEGVGEDAVANGWGIRVDKASNIEIRNLAFMNCRSTERDNVGLWQDNAHVWVHNCDFFYGEPGSEADQKKGDGMLDCKKSDWVTFSYNHFWDSGKSSLLGLEENSNDYHATYHHNWFDHSDSRHPRVRYYTTHIYNNYYDGVAKYGIGGAAGGASIFSEKNYFKNTNRPMIISMQGNDSGTLSNEEGSIIKSFGDYMDDTSKSNFIAYSSAAAVSAALETMSDFMKYVALDDEPEVPDVNDVIPGADDIVDENDVENSDTDKTSDEEEIIVTDADKSEDEEDTLITDTDKSEDEEDEVITDTDKSEDEEDTLDTEAEVSKASSSADPSVDFDAYVAGSRDETVPDNVKSKNGNHKYNNFDTTDFYSYTPDAATDVPTVVKSKAGRINGGDFSFAFTDADNSSSDLNVKLKEQCENYTTKLKAIGGIANTDVKIYYTITFDPGNGTDTYSVKVEKEALIAQPSDPTPVPAGKERFGGWYNGPRRWDFENDKAVKNMTLTGKWLAAGEEADPYGRLPIGNDKTIIYDITTQGYDSAYFDVIGNMDTQGSNEKSGTYNGVNYSSGGNDKKTRLDMRNSGTVTFTTTKTVRLILFLAQYNSGKNTNIDGKPYEQTNGIISTIIQAGEHTITRKDGDFLYAIWTEPIDSSEKYIVTLDLADGSKKITKPITVGEQITESDIPGINREGYKLRGWKDEQGRIINLPYTPTGDVTLTAVWVHKDDIELTVSEIENGTYSNSFEKNGFTIMPSVTVEGNSKTINGKTYTSRLKIDKNGTATSKSIKFTTTGAATLYIACISSSSSASRKMGVATVDGVDYKGEVFIDGSAEDCSDGNIPVSGTNPGRYITLELPGANTYYIYAKDGGINFYYVRVTHKAYTVTFNTNGGTSVAAQTVNSGGTCNEPVDVPTKDDYIFAGWYSDEELTQTYDFTSPVVKDITLFAKWVEGYIVTFNTNGGSEVPAQPIERGKTCTRPTNPTKDNYTFAGWYSDEDLTQEYDFETPVTSGITLYAMWTRNPEKPKGFNIKFKNDQTQYTYTGSAIKPEITVTYNGEPLVENTDYAVKYSNNIKAASKELKTDAKKLPKITVTGKGKYSGNDYVNFEILQKNLEDSNVTVSGVVKTDNSADTDDTAETKTITVVQNTNVAPVICYNNIKLTAKDYTVTGTSGKKYTSADNGKKLTITGNGNYKGKIELTLNVIEKGEKFTASFDKDAVKDLAYNGKAQKIAPVLSPKNMVENTDYMLQYSDAVNAGTVKCTVIGMGKYTGCTVTKTYKIKPAVKKNNNDFIIEALPNNGVYTFESAGVTLGDDLKVYDKGIKIDENNNKLLELGKDYKVTYSNNKQVSTTSKKASYKITFIGNYKGSSPISNSFTIDKLLLCNNSEDEEKNTKRLDDIVFPNKVSNGKEGVYKSVPYVSIDGIALKKSDYTVEYYKDSAFKTPMDAKNMVSAGDTVYVKITGKGNYDSTDSYYIKAEYTVQNKPTNTICDLSKASVTLNAKSVEYTGDVQIDNVKEITIKVNGTKQTIASKDFDVNGIKVDYVNNKAKGKATIVISGDGTKFVGSKTTTFSIAARKFKLASAAN